MPTAYKSPSTGKRVRQSRLDFVDQTREREVYLDGSFKMTADRPALTNMQTDVVNLLERLHDMSMSRAGKMDDPEEAAKLRAFAATAERLAKGAVRDPSLARPAMVILAATTPEAQDLADDPEFSTFGDGKLVAIYRSAALKPSTNAAAQIVLQRRYPTGKVVAAAPAPRLPVASSPPSTTDYVSARALVLASYNPDALQRVITISSDPSEKALAMSILAQKQAPASPDPNDPDDAVAKAEWAKMSADARSAWLDQGTYICYRRAEARGQIKGRYAMQ